MHQSREERGGSTARPQHVADPDDDEASGRLTGESLQEPLAEAHECVGVPGRQEAAAPFAAVRVLDAQSVELRYRIAKGYYLYRDKMKFTPQGEGLALGAPTLPDGEIKDDPEFGEVHVFKHAAELLALLSPLTSSAAPAAAAPAPEAAPAATPTATARLVQKAVLR